MENGFVLFWKRMFDFKGKSSRREFWFGVLGNVLIMLALLVLLIISLTLFKNPINSFSITMLILFALFCLVELLPSAALIFRRMHDIGLSGSYICVLLIPVFGWIWYIFLVTRKSGYFKK